MHCLDNRDIWWIKIAKIKCQDWTRRPLFWIVILWWSCSSTLYKTNCNTNYTTINMIRTYYTVHFDVKSEHFKTNLLTLTPLAFVHAVKMYNVPQLLEFDVHVQCTCNWYSSKCKASMSWLYEVLNPTKGVMVLSNWPVKVSSQKTWFYVFLF